MILEIFLVVLSACLFAEFFGYWLHVLMHGEKIQWLSRAHMIHHLLLYPPNGPQRSAAYADSVAGRANLLGLGMEWVVPISAILAALLAVFYALGVPPLHQAVFIAVSLAWGGAVFWYMHDAMHIRGFWMEEHRFFRPWFLRARRRHDIHHMDLDDSGRMVYNYGICLFLFDRLFGTLLEEHRRFNSAGLEASRRRYAFIFETGGQAPEA